MNQEVKQIDTSKYNTEGKVQVDGMIWSIKLPGAGQELELSKAQRRLKLIEKKINADNYDEADLDQYDKLEELTYKFFTGMFKDDTPDNSEVKAWLENTPLGVIVQAFQDIKEQAAEKSS